MNSKNSQISVFIIIGIVVLILVGMTVYLAGFMVKKNSERDIKFAKGSIESVIDQYVNSCIEKVLFGGLRTLGEQGGVIYDWQGGNYMLQVDNVNSDYVVYKKGFDIFYVHYGIDLPLTTTISNKDYNDELYPYPWVCFPYLDKNDAKSLKESDALPCKDSKDFSGENGIFGSKVLVPLYNTDGDNSIQETLENFINNNISKCLDFSRFNEQGIEVSIGNIQTTLDIKPESLDVMVSMPTEINRIRSNEVKSINTYKLHSNIRLGKLYQFLSELIDNDVTNIDFKLTESFSTLPSYDTNIVLDSIEQDVNGLLKDDLITFKDKSSKIDEGLRFTFARKNRRHALYYLKSQSDKIEYMDPDEDVEDTVKCETVPNPNKIVINDGVYKDSQIVSWIPSCP